MSKKLTALSLSAVLPLLFLTFYSGARARGKTVTICGTVKIDRVSTAPGVNFFSTQLEDLLFTPLANFDSRNLHYILVEDAKPLRDGSLWEIKLKGGVRFHNGQPLTAEDVAFSIEKRREIDSSLNQIRWTRVLDSRRIRLKFAKPQRDVDRYLTSIYVYPRGIFRPGEKWQEALLKDPVGSGPFKFSRWLDSGIELIANDNYFDGRPKIEKVVYIYEKDENRRITHLLNGTADILTPVSPEAARFLENDPGFSVNKLISPYYTAVFLNNRSPLFEDKSVRKAVNMAIERGHIIETGLNGGGAPAHGPFPQDMLPDGYGSQKFEYAPKAAVSLLSGAGWNDADGDGVVEKDGKRFRFRLYYMTDQEELHRVAGIIAQQLFEVGIEVETVPVTNAKFMENFPSGGYDAVLTTISALVPERTWQSRSLRFPNSYNFSDFINNDADMLFDKAMNAKDPLEVKRIYGRIDRIIYEDSPAIFLYNPVSYSAASMRFKNAEKFRDTAYDFHKIKDWE